MSKAGRPSPYAAPDYHPPVSAPEAFKRIVAFMQSSATHRTLLAVSGMTGVAVGTLTRYMDLHAGKTRLSNEMISKIESAAAKL